MKRLSIFFAALMACTLSFAETDYSTTYTSNVTVAAGDKNTSEADIVIGENTYKGMKAGAAKKTGSIKIIVPANQTNLHIHAIAWKGAKGAKVNIAGAACTPATLTLADNAGISNNSPFTISGDMSEGYYFNVALTGITKETTLTLSCDKRFVVFGVNAVASQAVEATDIALDQNALELQQYKSAKLVATLTPAEATTTVEWKSSNEKVATVGNNGVVTAVGIGTADITATAGEHVATCAVTVSAATIYSCSEIVELAKDLANNEVLANGKYVVRGYVTEIVGTPSSDMEKYGNYSVWMADAKDGENVFEAYAATPIDDKKIANVGDFVEIVGDITKYKSTIETNKGTATIEILIPAPKMYTITAKVNDDAMGTVTGAGEYEENATATLTANANEGYEFVNWTVGEETKTDNPLTITVAADMTITASFQEKATPIKLFTIEKMWESTDIPAAVEARQGVGYDGKVFVHEKTAKTIWAYTQENETVTKTKYIENIDATAVGIAIDNAGNMIVLDGFAGSNPSTAVIINATDKTTKKITFTLPKGKETNIGRNDYIFASGNIFSAEGGCLYLYPTAQTTIMCVKITNGAAATEDVVVSTIGTGWTAGMTASTILVDMDGNIVAQPRSADWKKWNVTENKFETISLPNAKKSTAGACTFELGGKEFYAYNVGTTNYNSEWNLYNMTDEEFVSEESLFVKDKTTTNTAYANWLTAQKIDDKTAYIYQYCPNVGVAAWKVKYNSSTPTDIEDATVKTVAPKAVKVFHNGQVYIIRDGKTYDMMGQMVE